MTEAIITTLLGAKANVISRLFILILFQKAWMNSRDLEVYGNGENIVPTIHIKDLSTWVSCFFFSIKLWICQIRKSKNYRLFYLQNCSGSF